MKLLILLGICVGSAFFIFANFVLGYDRETTHPALTDEVVDFYNLAFPNKQLTENDKRWLIQGSIDEDTPPRWFNHFYDPIYNQGWLGYTSSKVWAYSSERQVAFLGGKSQTAGFAQFFMDEGLSADDYSYQRALYDYAMGDRKRAMIAIGHIMHLLEDANVPDHTRNDTHLPFPSTESPYEKEMAKRNPGNLDIASKIFASGARPVLLKSLGDYFDKIAGYSNGYFFSEDTILSERYALPKKISEKLIEEDGVKKKFAMGRDKNGELFPLFRIDSLQHWRNLTTETNFTIKSLIVLDDYWSRLSRDFIPLGAGALRLFLEQAERVKEEYPKKQRVILEPSPFKGILGLLGFSNQSEPRLAFDPAIIDSILTQPAVPESAKIHPASLPIVSPFPSPFSPFPSPLSSPSSPLPSPSSSLPSPSPAPLTPLASPTQTPAQKTSQAQKSGRVVVNEVAWAGTSASAADEWIELYNTENEPIDLSMWVLRSEDSSPNIIFPEGSLILPKGYFLIERTSDDTISSIKADLIASFGGGGLKDTGEVLLLSDSSGYLVDKVGISGLPWYAGGTSSKLSMERIDPLRRGDDQTNWKAFSGTSSARDAKGGLINGTPRGQNSPAIVVAGGGGSGFSSSSSSSSPTPSPSPSPSPGSGLAGSRIVINEIAWMGTAASPNDEWLELYNTSSKSVDLSGWRLRSLTDNTPNIIFASKSIEPFGFFLLERTDDMTVSDVSADHIYTGALSNTGEVLELRDKNGDLQDLVSKSADGWYAGKNVGKYTMERIDPFRAGDDPTNWATNDGTTRNGNDASGNPINGTPRARNSVYANKPPSTVSDLKIDTEASFFGNIRLTWSTPKDDDDPPWNLTYDLRYSTRSFDTLADWESASKVASFSLPAVAESGALALASFQVLDYNKNYYFALKTCDRQDCSGISNQAEYIIKPAISEEITTFRGPAHPTISWEFQVPDGGHLGQPVAAKGGTIYFGASNEATGIPRLYAVDPTGAEKWHHDNEIAGYGMPTTPAVSDDGAVYYGHLSSWVTALNFDGSLRWQFDTARVNSVGIDEDGGVSFTSDNRTITRVGPSGVKKWQVTDPMTFDSTPIALPGDKDIYLGFDWSGLPGFYRLRGNDGSSVWQSRVSDSTAYRAYDPVFDKVTNKFYAATTAGHIISVNRSDGALNSHLFAFGASATTRVAIFEDTLLVGVDFTSQNPASGQALVALNKADKLVKWSFSVDSAVNKQIAVDGDGNLYFTTRAGRLYSLDKNGQQRWVLDLGVPTELYPILGENAVFMGINGSDGGKLLKISDF